MAIHRCIKLPRGLTKIAFGTRHCLGMVQILPLREWPVLTRFLLYILGGTQVSLVMNHRQLPTCKCRVVRLHPILPSRPIRSSPASQPLGDSPTSLASHPMPKVSILRFWEHPLILARHIDLVLALDLQAFVKVLADSIYSMSLWQWIAVAFICPYEQGSYRSGFSGGYNVPLDINPFNSWARVLDCGDIPVTSLVASRVMAWWCCYLTGG